MDAQQSLLKEPESQWLYTKEELAKTPSFADGLSSSQEREFRVKGILFINNVAMNLKLPQLTISTASAFFHRFYMRYSFTDYKFYDIGATCIYLASKTEESTRKFKDVLMACAKMAAKKEIPWDENSKDYRLWKETIIYNEELLLEALCFDLTVEHPFPPMLHIFDQVKDQNKAKRLKMVAWGFLVDSLRTTLCLQYSPRTIGHAAAYAAAIYLEENLNQLVGQVWREAFEPDKEDINSVAHEFMDIFNIHISRSGRYDKVQPPPTPPPQLQDDRYGHAYRSISPPNGRLSLSPRDGHFSPPNGHRISNGHRNSNGSLQQQDHRRLNMRPPHGPQHHNEDRRTTPVYHVPAGWPSFETQAQSNQHYRPQHDRHNQGRLDYQRQGRLEHQHQGRLDNQRQGRLDHQHQGRLDHQHQRTSGQNSKACPYGRPSKETGL